MHRRGGPWARGARRAVVGAAVGAGGACAYAGAARARAAAPAKTGKVKLRRGGKTAHSRDEVARIFKELDADGSGEIDAEELQAGLGKLGLPSSDEYVSDIFTHYDMDGSGRIDEQEFRNYVRKKERAMYAAFSKLDTDASGAITGEELVVCLKRAGVQVPPGDAGRMVALLDANRDGVVTFDEFKKYLCLLPSAQVKQNATWCWLGSSADRVVTNPRDPFKQLAIGGIAGAASRTFTAPIERVRVMLMASKGVGAVDLLKQTLKEDGVVGLWRGNMAKVAKMVPAAAIQFFVYNQVKDLFTRRSGKGDVTTPERLVAGAASAITATLIVYPLDTIGAQMGVAGGAKGNIPQVASQIYARAAPPVAAGLKGFYRGLSATVVSDVWGIGMGFVFYDLANSAFTKLTGRKPRASEKGLVGGTTACLSMTVAMPLEIVMTRMRVQGLPGYPVVYKSALDCVAKIAKEEGVKTLWRGLVPAYLKVFPMIFTSYFVFEALSKKSGIGGLKRYREA